MRAQSRLPVVAVAAVASALATGIVIQVSSLKLNLRRVVEQHDHSHLLNSLTPAERRRRGIYFQDWHTRLSLEDAEARSHADAQDAGTVTAEQIQTAVPSVPNFDSSVVRALTLAESELLHQNIPISELQQWPMESLEQRMAALMNLLESQDEGLNEQYTTLLHFKINELSDVIEEQTQLQRALEFSLMEQVPVQVDESEELNAAIAASVSAEAERLRAEEAESHAVLDLSRRDHDEAERLRAEAAQERDDEVVAKVLEESVRSAEEDEIRRQAPYKYGSPEQEQRENDFRLRTGHLHPTTVPGGGIEKTLGDGNCGFYSAEIAMKNEVTVKHMRGWLSKYCSKVQSAVLGIDDSTTAHDALLLADGDKDESCSEFEGSNSFGTKQINQRAMIALSYYLRRPFVVHKPGDDQINRIILEPDVIAKLEKEGVPHAENVVNSTIPIYLFYTGEKGSAHYDAMLGPHLLDLENVVEERRYIMPEKYIPNPIEFEWSTLKYYIGRALSSLTLSSLTSERLSKTVEPVINPLSTTTTPQIMVA